MNLDETKSALVGEWQSIAPEVRPSAGKNADGSLKPFYLERTFKYAVGDRFELSIVNSADANGAVPLARIFIAGHIRGAARIRSQPARRKSISWPTRATR